MTARHYRFHWLNIVAGSLFFVGSVMAFALFNGPNVCVGWEGTATNSSCYAEPGGTIAGLVLPLLAMVIGLATVITGIERRIDD